MNCRAPTTIRSRRSIVITRRARTWPTRWAASSRFMASKERGMDRETLEYEMEPEVKTGERESRESLEASRPPRRKGAGRMLLVFGVLALLIAAGTYLWMHSLNRVSTDDAQVDGHIDPVSAKISGNVTDVMVNDNQAVKKGQILVRIDPRDYQAKVDQARAALAVAESEARAAGV